jgi:hypothetical protein
MLLSQKCNSSYFSIVVGGKIGEGAFGQVYKGFVQNARGLATPVAIKMAKEDSNEVAITDLIKVMQLIPGDLRLLKSKLMDIMEVQIKRFVENLINL